MNSRLFAAFIVATLFCAAPDAGSPLYGQSFDDPKAGKLFETVVEMINQDQLDEATESIDREIETYSDSESDFVLLCTLRRQLAQKRMLERNFDEATKQFKSCAVALSEHLENPTAQLHCVSALNGLNNLLRLDHPAARDDELMIGAIESLLQLEEESDVGPATRFAGEIATSYAFAPGTGQSYRDQLQTIITAQISRLETQWSAAPLDSVAIALSGFYSARGNFHANEVGEYRALTADHETFLRNALQQMPSVFPLATDLANLTVRRISAIASAFPNDARESLKATVDTLEATEAELGSRIIVYIDSVKRMSDRIPEHAPSSDQESEAEQTGKDALQVDDQDEAMEGDEELEGDPEANSEEVVLSYLIADPDSNPDGVPALQVFSDGRVVSTPDPQAGAHEMKLSPTQLSALTDTVMKVQKFGEFDAREFERARAEIDQKFPGCAMSPQITITSELSGEAIEAEVGAAYVGLQFQFPDIESLAGFCATDRTCRQLIYTAVVGSFDELIQIISEVNESAAQQYDDFEPFKLNEIQFASRTEDGLLTVYFDRQVGDKDRPTQVTATWTEQSDGPGIVAVEMNFR